MPASTVWRIHLQSIGREEHAATGDREVSTDGGETWNDAHVEDHADRYLWRRWS